MKSPAAKSPAVQAPPSGQTATVQSPETQASIDPKDAELDALRMQVQSLSELLENRTKPAPLLGSPKIVVLEDGRRMYQYEAEGHTTILPKPVEECTEQDYFSLMPFSMMDIEHNRIPQNLTVVGKDPQYAFHWFNKKNKSGARVGEGRAMGFMPAKIEDLKWVSSHLNDKDGAVEQDDLILMKIHKAVLFARAKHWMDTAAFRGSVNGYKDQAATMVSPGNQGRVKFDVKDVATNEMQGLGPVSHERVIYNQGTV